MRGDLALIGNAGSGQPLVNFNPSDRRLSRADALLIATDRVALSYQLADLSFAVRPTDFAALEVESGETILSH